MKITLCYINNLLKMVITALVLENHGLLSDLEIEQTIMHFIKSRGSLICGRGVTGRIRTILVSVLHHCATVYQVMST